MSDRMSKTEPASDGRVELQSEMNKYGHALKLQMAPLKVETATRAGDRSVLEDAVRNFDELGQRDTSEAVDARQLLDNVIKYETVLTEACDQKDSQKISRTLEEIRAIDNDLAKRYDESSYKPRVSLYLRKTVERAQRLADELAIVELPPPVILAMDRKTMTELKSYVKPAPMVHRVMQAVFLLLNEDEEKTARWTHCQKLCVPDGPEGLNWKLMNFDQTKVDPFIKQRVQVLLKGVDLRDVQRASPGAATFFVWASTVVSLERGEEKDATSETSKAAGPKLTREQRVEKEHAELKRCIKKEKAIFSKLTTTAGTATDALSQHPRKINYYSPLH